MKLTKRIIIVLLLVLFIIVLYGCGNADTCPSCSKDVDFSKDIFCSNCGYSLASAKSDGSDICPNCSNEVDYSKDIFCSNCGYSFASSKSEGYSTEPESLKSNEEKGVPDEIIHKEIESMINHLLNYSMNCKVDIQHDVNTTTHIDTVYAHLSVSTEYGTETDSIMFEYQYDRSSDLWDKLGESDWQRSFNPNKDAFIGTWELYIPKDDISIYLYIYDVSETSMTLGYFHPYTKTWDEEVYIDNEVVELYNRVYDTASLLVDWKIVTHVFAYLDIAGVHSEHHDASFAKIY